MKSKILAGLLAITMILTGLPETAFAVTVDSEEKAVSAGENNGLDLIEEIETESEEPTEQEAAEVETEEDTESLAVPESTEDTEKTGTEAENEEDSQTITEFAEIEDPVLSLPDRLPLSEALEQLPETLEVYVEEEEEWTEVPVTWECVDDYDNEDLSSFVFVATPEGEETEVDEAAVSEEDLPRMEIYYDSVYTAISGEGGRMVVSRTLSDSSLIMESMEEDSEELTISSSAKGIWVSSDDREFFESLDNDDCHKLSNAQKSYYETLDAELDAYLYDGKAASSFNVGTLSGSTVSYSATAMIAYDAETFNNYSGNFQARTDVNNIQTLTSAYLYSHPQYFFLTTSYLTTDTGGKIAINFLPSFVSTSSRKSAAAQIKSNITAMLNSSGGTDYEVMLQLHKALCDRVSYDDKADLEGDDASLQSKWLPGNAMYDQSMASVFYGTTKTTVCAGYSQSYAALCNAAGIPAFSVTSATHQWNKVKTADYWFNVDVTWDDGGMGDQASYNYFLKSDAKIKSYNSSAKLHHTLDGYWTTFLATNPTELSNYNASTIIFDLGGEGSLNEVEGKPTYAYPVGIGMPTLSTYVPVSDTYEFAGWYMDSGKTMKLTQVPSSTTDSVTAYAKWKLPNYTITYILNGGTGGAEAPTSYDSASDIFVISDPEASGREFADWYLDSELTMPLSATSYAVRVDGETTVFVEDLKNELEKENRNLTLYAGWKYGEIQYDANALASEINGAMEPQLLSGAGTPPSSLAAAACGYTRANYSFKEWNTEANGEGTSYEAGDTIPSSAITGSEGAVLKLYAMWKWNPTGLTVTYDANGGEFQPNFETSVVVPEKASFVTPSATGVTRIGYTLSGWIYTDEAGKQTTYSPGKSVKNTTAVGTKWTLTAKWTKNTYTITYQLDGGSNNSLNPKSFDVESGALTFYKATKNYYEFQGWSFEKDGAIINDFSASALVAKADSKKKVTLYAKFAPYQYKVVYHLNAGNAETVPSTNVDDVRDFMGMKTHSDTVDYGVSGVYFSSVVRDNYKLTSWNTRIDGKGTKYTPGATFKNLSTVNNDTIDLYAQWTASKTPTDWESYTIQYFDSYEDNGVTKRETPKLLKEEANLAPGVKYTFYTVDDNKVDGYKNGYTLSGWQYTSEDGKTKKTYKPEASFTGLKSTLKLSGDDPIKLYAVWTLNTYSITYANMTGAKHDTKNNLTSYTPYNKTTGVEKTITLTAPTTDKTGYTFTGWYWDSELETSVADNRITPEIADNHAEKKKLTIYAGWKPIEYNVAYYASAEDYANDKPLLTQSDVEYGATNTTYAEAPTLAGYTFAGWAKNNNGTKYKAGAKYTNLSKINGDTVKMVAQWTVASYKITYNLRNGDGSGGNPTTYKITTDDFTLKDGKRANAVFLGWYETEAAAKNAEKLKSATSLRLTASKTKEWAKTGNITLYAAWQCQQYQVRYEPNFKVSGGSGTEFTATVNYGDSFLMPDAEKYALTGYTLLGWNQKSNATSATYTLTKTYKNLTAKANETVTLYAVWKEKPRTISYVLNSGSKYTSSKDYTYQYPTTYRIKEDVQISPLKRTGYQFAGWYKDATFKTPLAHTDIVAGSEDRVLYTLPYTESDTAIKLYAKWEASYTVFYDMNGGTFGADSVEEYSESREVGESFYMLGANKEGRTGVSRTGYTLLGWGTKANATSATYTLTKEYKNLKTKDGDTITLYAVWKPLTITYNLNGGSKIKNALYPTKYEGINGASVQIPWITKTGNDFGGWYLDPDFKEPLDENFDTAYSALAGGEIGYSSLNPGRFKDGIRLYAKWEPYEYQVRYWVSKEEYEANKDKLNAEPAEWELYEAIMAASDRLQKNCKVGESYFASTRAYQPGLTLTGWTYEVKSGTRTTTKTLTPGAKFKSLSTENDAVIDLIAVWKTGTVEYGTATATASGTGTGKITLDCALNGYSSNIKFYPVAMNRNTGAVEYLLDADTGDTGITAYSLDENHKLNIDLVLSANTPNDGLNLVDHSFRYAYAVDGKDIEETATADVRLQMMSLGAAIILSDGTLQAVTNAAYVTHPETLASTSLFQTTQTKKGIQIDDGEGLAAVESGLYNFDHAFVNLRIAEMYLDGPYTDYGEAVQMGCNFSYNGKYYRFNSDAAAGATSTIRRLSSQGINVTGQILLEYIIDPATKVPFPSTTLINEKARKAGSKFYSWEDTKQQSRETTEALAVWLGRALSQSGCYVSNWILGNEVNSYKAWQYSGSMTKDEFYRSYAETMHIFYNGIKSTNSDARFYVCTDNNWNKATYGYSSKNFLDTFHTTMDTMDSTLEWGIAFHPYSSNLTSTAANSFWKNSGVTGTDTSTYVNMSNLDVLTNHAKAYTADGSVPDIILSEMGYTPGTYGTLTEANKQLQAAALIYSYALAAKNDDIDAIMIRSLNQTAEKPYLGIASDISNPTAVNWYESGELYAKVNRADSVGSVIERLDGAQYQSIWKTINAGYTTFSDMLRGVGIDPANPTVLYQ